MEKYELLKDDTKEISGRTLYRIKALRDFGDVEKGDLGGYIGSENNLSHCGNAWVYGNAEVYGNAMVCGNARVWGDAWVHGNAEVRGDARVYGNAEVWGDAWVYGNAMVCGDARVWGNAMVCGNAWVHGNTEVRGDAVIKSTEDYIVFKNNWSSGRYFTYTKSNKMWKVGCFYGTGEELIKKAYADSELSGKCYEAYVKLVEQLEEIQEVE